MRRLFVFLLASALSSTLFAADPADLVHQAATGWMDGAVAQDAAALERFLADDLQYAHASGSKQTKEEYIRAVTNGPSRYEAFTLSDLKIVIYGEAAVLTAYCDVKMLGRDSFRVRTLQAYVNNDGQWQMAAHQSARMQPRPTR